MDLHLTQARPSDEERAAVDALLGPPETSWTGGDRAMELDGHVARSGREARERRHLLLPALHAVQDHIGWISEGALNYVSRRLTVAPAEAYGVASFYALFSTEPRPPTVVHVCDDLACRVNGSEDLCTELERSIGPAGHADSGDATWLRSPCLGMCEEPIAMLVQHPGRADLARGRVASEQVLEAMGGQVAVVGPPAGPVERRAEPGFRHVPQTWRPETDAGLRLLRRIGHVDPTAFDDYHAAGGYEPLRTAVALGSAGVVRELRDAGLKGRGGAAFPTGVKWEAVATQPVRPHYFVCNADESEPGTFKDRIVMEHDPFAVIESLTIAGYVTGSERGYIYLRGEYPLALQRLQHAIEQARERGYLGANVMGEGFDFDIEIRRGAGAYICGEETALFNSIEGRRGEPRNKPPFPVTHGLFGKPTGINNVETLINVLEILRIGGPAYAEIGTPDSTGPRLFCLSGHVTSPGLYEVPHGVSLGELLDLAGGVRAGGQLKAVLLGGAAGSFVGPEAVDLRLTFEDTRAAGVTLGSGVVMAFDESANLADVLLRIASFFRDESCGQCVPCRVGTVRQEEALHRLAGGAEGISLERELALLGEIAQVMRDASICGLGQTAANAVQSAISGLGVLAGAAASGDASIPSRSRERES